MQYAGVWSRFAAYWLDVIVLLPLTGLVIWLAESSRLFYLYYFLPGLLIQLYFHVYLVARYGGTPGKLIMGLRIVKTDGSAAGYSEAIWRYSVMFLLGTLSSMALMFAVLKMTDTQYAALTFQNRMIHIVALAPFWYQPVNLLLQLWVWSEFIVILTNQQRRALHDFIAGTVVIYANATENITVQRTNYTHPHLVAKE